MKKLFLMCALVGLFVSQAAVANATHISGDGTWLFQIPQEPGGSAQGELDALIEWLSDPTNNPGTYPIPDDDLEVTNPGNILVEPDQTSLDIQILDYDYLKIKWDGQWVYYYVAGLEVGHTYEFNSTVFNQGSGQPQAASHIAWFGPGTSVPDGGATLGLLGSALFGLGLFGRRKK